MVLGGHAGFSRCDFIDNYIHGRGPPDSFGGAIGVQGTGSISVMDSSFVGGAGSGGSALGIAPGVAPVWIEGSRMEGSIWISQSPAQPRAVTIVNSVFPGHAIEVVGGATAASVRVGGLAFCDVSTPEIIGGHQVFFPNCSSGLCNDQDNDGVPDDCLTLLSTDCNSNDQTDSLDVALGIATDCDVDGTLDECEAQSDCDSDGVSDACEIASGAEVDSNANGVPDSCEHIRVPSDFPTIQAAVDAVGPGTSRIVEIAPGIYNEPFSLNGKDVVIRGAPNDATILDGTDLATSIARFTGGEPATAGLEGLVFRNGAAGSRIVPKATFTVGGAVYGRDSSAFIRNCRFEQNEADFGGAVYLLRCDSAVEGCVFAGNEALTDGGAFLAYECAGFVRASDFTANSCGASGSGNGGAFKTVGAKSVDGTFLLQDCTITGTMSGVDGAAVHHFENLALGTAGALRIVDTEISGNTTIVGAGGVRHDGRQSSLVLAGATVVCPNTVRNIDGPFLLESGATVCDCLTDVTGDGSVNGGDLGVVLNAWGLADAQGTGDVNHDGVVDGADLALVLGSWGACP